MNRQEDFEDDRFEFYDPLEQNAFLDGQRSEDELDEIDELDELVKLDELDELVELDELDELNELGDLDDELDELGDLNDALLSLDQQGLPRYPERNEQIVGKGNGDEQLVCGDRGRQGRVGDVGRNAVNDRQRSEDESRRNLEDYNEEGKGLVPGLRSGDSEPRNQQNELLHADRERCAESDKKGGEHSNGDVQLVSGDGGRQELGGDVDQNAVNDRQRSEDELRRNLEDCRHNQGGKGLVAGLRSGGAENSEPRNQQNELPYASGENIYDPIDELLDRFKDDPVRQRWRTGEDFSDQDGKGLVAGVLSSGAENSEPRNQQNELPYASGENIYDPIDELLDRFKDDPVRHRWRTGEDFSDQDLEDPFVFIQLAIDEASTYRGAENAEPWIQYDARGENRSEQQQEQRIGSEDRFENDVAVRRDVEQVETQDEGVQNGGENATGVREDLPEHVHREVPNQGNHAVNIGYQSQNPPLDNAGQELTEDGNQDLPEQVPEDNQQAQQQIQGEVLDIVEHDQQHVANLQWLSVVLPHVDERELEGALQHGETADLQFITDPAISDSTRVPEGPHGLHVRTIHGAGAQGVPQTSTDFSSQLTAMRLAKTSHDEISKAIAVPRILSWNDEMDSGFQLHGTADIPWAVEEGNSLTLARIAEDVKQRGDLFFISSEVLFNHLFRLCRSSFLQREESIHLELMSDFFSSWHTEKAMEFERDTKEFIMWLERKFVPAKLAAMTQKLVHGIDANCAIRYLAQTARMYYNPNPVGLTMLGAFYGLMNTFDDITESKKRMGRRKKKVDAGIKDAKKTLQNYRQKAPKATYGKSITPHKMTMMARKEAMVHTFAGTRWLIVGSADAHYAYGCSVLEAAEGVSKAVQENHYSTLEQLKNEKLNLARQETAEVELGTGLEDTARKRKEVVEWLRVVERREIDAVESTLLNCYATTMAGLGKIKVVDLLRSIGGRIPKGFARVLEEKCEEIENLRGVGYLDGLVVDGIVRMKGMVEKEKEKKKATEKLLERRTAYLQECQNMIQMVEANIANAIANGAGPSHGAGPSDVAGPSNLAGPSKGAGSLNDAGPLNGAGAGS